MLAKLLRSIKQGSAESAARRRFESARAACANGQFEAAEREFVAFANAYPEQHEARYLAGLCASRRGAPELARQYLAAAFALDDITPENLVREADAVARSGAVPAAIELCRQALLLRPKFGDARVLWSNLELPGENYLAFLPHLHDLLKPATYVEVGVFQGSSLRFVGPHTRAIGIDPAPQLQFPVPATARVFTTTSDEFFAAHDVRAELGGRGIDLGFIDGMHLFEYALRDFINMERACAPGATLLIHDCYPLDRASAERDYVGQFWSGDIWRLIALLKKYRPDLEVHTLALAPTGLGFVRGLDPSSEVLPKAYDSIVAEFMALDYEVLADDKPGMLNLVRDPWQEVGRFIT